MADVEVDSFRPDSGPVNDDLEGVSPYFLESTVSPNDNLQNGDNRLEIKGRGEESATSEDEEVIQHAFSI